MAADAYDPAATSGAASPAAYAAALAAEMGVPAEAVTVTAVRNADGTYSVTAVVDAGDNAAAAKALADMVGAKSPAELAAALNLPADAVTSVAPPTVAVDVTAAPGATEKN